MERFFLQLNEGDNECLKTLIKRKLSSVLIYHDTYPKANPLDVCSSISAWIQVDEKYVEIHNEETPCAFQNFENEHNIVDDIATFSIIDAGTTRPKHYLEGGIIDEFKIDEEINDIQIVTNTYRVKESEERNQELTYDVAIVFVLETQRLVFERQVWFSEFIDISSQCLDSELQLRSNKNCEEFDNEGDCETQFSQEIYSLKTI